MSLKMWGVVATLALLSSGCAATVPVAPPAASATESDLTLYAISDADLASLSDEQFAALSDQQIAALTQTQVAMLSESRRAAMTPSQRVALLLAHFSALTLPQVKALPPALFAALTPEQLRTLMPVHAQALTAEQLAALSPEQAAAAAAAAAAPDDAEGPSKALPPAPSGLAPAIYVVTINGLIDPFQRAGTQNFTAGQFGFTPSLRQPPVVVPRNPGIQFVPPPVFSKPLPGATPKPAAVDCEVRYVATQVSAQSIPTPLPSLSETVANPLLAPTSGPSPTAGPVLTTIATPPPAPTGTVTPPKIDDAPTAPRATLPPGAEPKDVAKKTYCN
jgi:hypothetical protein